jgi:PAS domain S-box-containing protein
MLDRRFRLSFWERYGGALLVVLIAAGIRLVFLQSLADRFAFLMLYPAVMFAAFLGGFGPGVLATIVSGGIAMTYWSQAFRFAGNAADWLGLCIFFVCSILMCGIAEVSRRARWRIEERTAALQRSNERLVEEVAGRREAEQKLRQSDERFRLAAFSDKIVLYEQDAELRYTWLYPDNPEMRLVLGRTDEEILGQAEASALSMRKREVLSSGVGDRVEFRATMQAGVRYYDTFISAKRGEDGSIVGLAGIALDITERKQAEENHRRLAAIVESSEDAIVGEDLDGTITSWNQGASRIFGFEAAEVVGKSISLLIPSDRREEWLHILDAVRRGERFDHMQTRRKRKDGSDVEISLTISPVRNDLGEIIGTSRTAREITERVRTEQTAQFLAMLNERLAAEDTPEAILRIASEITGQHMGARRCYFAEWNEASGHLNVMQDWHVEGFASISGSYELSEFGPLEWRHKLALGMAVEDTERDPQLRGFLGSYEAIGIRSFAASGFVRKGSSVISVVAAMNQPRAWRPDEIHLIKSVAERVWPLAERARSERALRRSERQLRLITDNAPVLLAHLDQAHRFKFVNQTFARLFRRGVAEIIGSHVRDVISPETYAASLPYLERSFSGQRVEYETEIFPAGEARWVHVIYTPEESITGTIVGVMALLTDITARKETEREVERARDQALAASRAKDDFLAALSHELRTPLNPVLLLASEAAENTALTPEIRRDFATIRKNVELEARLIDDLLDLTRITRGKLPLDQRYVEGHTILLDALAVIRPDADEKRIYLVLDLTAKATNLYVDAVRLQQVYWNVLKNAVKFTPAGGRIHLRTENGRDESTFMVTVRDTGIGMTPEELGRIFNAFAQGDHAGGGGSHRFGGLGLGLTISRMLVEHQAGTLTAGSAGPGQGSTFVIELPLASKPALDLGSSGVLAVPPQPYIDLPLRTPARRVLVVEDHGPTRDAVASLLRRRKYEVLTAASLGEARSRVKEGGIGLLVSDIGLPDGDGCDLMSELRDGLGLRGIALTGYGMEADVARSAKAGFLAHLTKPVRVQALDAALAAAWAAIELARS